MSEKLGLVIISLILGFVIGMTISQWGGKRWLAEMKYYS